MDSVRFIMEMVAVAVSAFFAGQATVFLLALYLHHWKH